MRPELKLLFMSGYTGEAVMPRGALDRGAALMQKPFTPKTLARRVREVLD
jgi:DNA-binding response OmpR family regulator